jgi:hypothetical protein
MRRFRLPAVSELYDLQTAYRPREVLFCAWPVECVVEIGSKGRHQVANWSPGCL